MLIEALLGVAALVGSAIAAGGENAKNNPELKGTKYEKLGSDLHKSGNDFVSNVNKLKSTFKDD